MNVCEPEEAVKTENPTRFTPISAHSYAQTTGNVKWVNVASVIPDSFLRALRDLEKGRLVDIDTAHSEAPKFRLSDD